MRWRHCPSRLTRWPRRRPRSAECSRRGISARSCCRCRIRLQPRGDRSYLITGGLGALGLHTAAYLAQLGAGDIVLTSRRMPDPAGQQAIAEMAERYHCRIHTFAADVADESQVTELLARIRSELPPLAGVAHLAGVLDDALLPDQSPRTFPHDAGAQGFWCLALASVDEGRRSRVLHRVLLGVERARFTRSGQLRRRQCAARRARRGPQGAGAAGDKHQLGTLGAGWHGQFRLRARQSRCARFDSAGAHRRTNALGEVIAHGLAQATVIKANWQRAAKLLGAIRPPILDHVLPSAVAATPGDSAFLAQLHDVPEAQRGSFVTEHLQRNSSRSWGWRNRRPQPAASWNSGWIP